MEFVEGWRKSQFCTSDEKYWPPVTIGRKQSSKRHLHAFDLRFKFMRNVNQVTDTRKTCVDVICRVAAVYHRWYIMESCLESFRCCTINQRFKIMWIVVRCFDYNYGWTFCQHGYPWSLIWVSVLSCWSPWLLSVLSHYISRAIVPKSRLKLC